MDNITGEDQSPFSALVGEGKKFKTPEDLARGKLEADKFIETLRQEKADLESRMTTLQVELEKKAKTQTPPQTGQAEASSSKDVPDIQALIDQRLNEREHTATRTRNLTSAKEHLIKVFGNSAEEALEKQSREMGISKDKLLDIASDAPAIFKRLFPEDKPKTQDPTMGTRSSEISDLNSTDTTSEYKSLSEQRKKMGVGRFFNDPKNWQRLVEAKTRELNAS